MYRFYKYFSNTFLFHIICCFHLTVMPKVSDEVKDKFAMLLYFRGSNNSCKAFKIYSELSRNRSYCSISSVHVTEFLEEVR